MCIIFILSSCVSGTLNYYVTLPPSIVLLLATGVSNYTFYCLNSTYCTISKFVINKICADFKTFNVHYFYFEQLCLWHFKLLCHVATKHCPVACNGCKQLYYTIYCLNSSYCTLFNFIINKICKHLKTFNVHYSYFGVVMNYDGGGVIESLYLFRVGDYRMTSPIEG